MPPKTPRSPFPPLYWLVVLFEFFERGSYYGMMSVLSVYMTDELHFAKQDVGVIKATIQPLLYFLPIISGALADRFGYRRTLMVAFSLLGSGYFLTSQATQYTWVFLALVVMGLGAGTFKPVISGTIARCTDESNSTLGFGIFYWSINLGAFLFPLVLVPYLKNTVGWDWVIIASAIGTGAMLLPTIFVFREPPVSKEQAETKARRATLLQTLANAFEIIYSPLVLLHHLLRRTPLGGGLLLLLLLGGTLGGGGWRFMRSPELQFMFTSRAYRHGDTTLVVRVERNLGQRDPFRLELQHRRATLTLYDPDQLQQRPGPLLKALHRQRSLSGIEASDLRRYVADARQRSTLIIAFDPSLETPFRVDRGDGGFQLTLSGPRPKVEAITAALSADPLLGSLSADQLSTQIRKAYTRPFFLPFVGLLLLAGLLAIRLAPRFAEASAGGKGVLLLIVVGAVLAVLWGLQLGGYLSLFGAILTTVIASTLCALFGIDHSDEARFRDHFRFLSMIFLYSGFWVLYFQMFDSVLWYVQAYVDASSLNAAVNGALRFIGVSSISFRFDVEHVTVINAGTIILLQLVVSSLVKNTRALPTMVVGIGLGTLGMGILAISTGIWVFMLGITIFSIGEMTAHPKFISYVGQTAPRDRVWRCTWGTSSCTASSAPASAAWWGRTCT